MNALRRTVPGTRYQGTLLYQPSLRERLSAVGYCELLAFYPTSLLDSLPLSIREETNTTLESTKASKG
jgi:hypothetical protein